MPTLRDALASAPVQSMIQSQIAEAVQEALRVREAAQVRPLVQRELSRQKAEARERRRRGLFGGDARSLEEVTEHLEVLEARRWGGERPYVGAVSTNGVTRGGRVLAALAGPVEEPDAGERVWDPTSSRVLEAAVAAVPAAERGWKERMRLAGCSDATLEALGDVA